MTCAVCAKRWWGISTGSIAQWHCCKTAAIRRADMPVIGSDAELKAKQKCRDFVK